MRQPCESADLWLQLYDRERLTSTSRVLANMRLDDPGGSWWSDVVRSAGNTGGHTNRELIESGTYGARLATTPNAFS
jgi:hypothetical protein